ncbi:phage tail tape measure protein [Prodigiosinella aquatilis]|nr:phage tail tape measure protein [Prodigiosinella sp. LS101]WJV52959.1 phage tail tape measure protein [Prodigiosinella sp. LS101]WJV57314.1 phage tail tape measure protein [Pectobacteriaceae bacterium C111]
MSDNNLRLQVIMNAVDKLTRPFKQAQASTQKLAAAVKKSQAQLKQLDNQAARIDGFRKTSTQAAVVSHSLKAAREEAARLARQFAATEKPTAQQTRLLGAAKNRVNELQGKYNGLRLSVQRQREALHASGLDTKKLSDAQRQLRRDTQSVTNALTRQQQALKRVGERQQKLNAIRSRYSRTMEARNKLSVNGAAITGAGVGMLYTSKRTMAPGFDFDQGMSKVQALTRLKKAVPEMAALRQQARQLGASTAFTANDVAQGQSFYAMAGFNPEQIRGAMPGTLNMSLAGDTDLATTANIGSNILTGFKLPANQMSRVGDSLVATFTRSNTNLQMLGETMKYVAPVAATLGVDLETASAAAGKLGDAGIQSSQAGTSLRAILARLASPPKAAAEALAELNIKTKDARGNLRPLTDLLSEMYARTQKMGNAKRASLFKHIAGEEAFSGLSVLVEQAGTGQLQKLVAEVRAAHGEAEKVAGTMTDNLSGDLKSLSSAWEDVGITLFDSVDSPLRAITHSVTALTSKVGGWLTQHPQLTRVITGTVLALGSFLTMMGTIILSVAAILGPMALLRLSCNVLGIKAVSAFGLIRGALGIVGKAVLWLGRLMMANPILAIISLIAMGALYIWQHWDTLGPKFKALWDAICNATSAAWEWVKNAISTAWEGIKSYFLNYTLPGLIYKNWDAIKAGVSEAWENIKKTISDRWNELVSTAESMPARFQEAGSQLIDGLMAGINEKWELLKTKLASLTDYLPDWMKPDSKQMPSLPTVPGAAGAGSAVLNDIPRFDTGGVIPSGRIGIVGENGPEIVNGPARITSRRRTAALAASAAMMLGAAAQPVMARPLHPFSLPTKEYAVSRPEPRPSSLAPVSIHAPITIVTQPGQNATDIAREVARQLDEREHRARAKSRSNYRDQGGIG